MIPRGRGPRGCKGSVSRTAGSRRVAPSSRGVYAREGRRRARLAMNGRRRARSPAPGLGYHGPGDEPRREGGAAARARAGGHPAHRGGRPRRPVDRHVPAVAARARRALRDAPATAQLTVTLFLVGLAVAQFVFGPLSDRFGRRWVLIGGLCVYAVAGLVCAVAPSIRLLVAARVLQAFGAERSRRRARDRRRVRARSGGAGAGPHVERAGPDPDPRPHPRRLPPRGVRLALRLLRPRRVRRPLRRGRPRAGARDQRAAGRDRARSPRVSPPTSRRCSARPPISATSPRSRSCSPASSRSSRARRSCSSPASA